MNKNNYILLLVAVIPIYLCSSCEFLLGDCPGAPDRYLFNIPATLSPAQDTFRIGDSIHVVSMFFEEVEEVNSGRRYPLKNMGFEPVTIVVRIDSVNTGGGGLSMFDVWVEPEYDYQEFLFSSGNRALVGEYRYIDRYYQLAYTLIPKQKGVFFMRFASALDERSRWPNFPGRCKRKSINIQVTMNNRIGTNIHLLAQSPDPHYSKWRISCPDECFHRIGGYCFVVVE